MIKKTARKFLEKVLSANGYVAVPKKRWDHLVQLSAFSRAELNLPKYLGQILRSKKIDCVFDVGANAGQFATMLRTEANYTGWIVSFEPIPELAESLARLAESDPKWEIIDCALGRQPGRRDLNKTEENVFSSFLEPHVDQPSAYAESNRVVETVSVRVDNVNAAWESYKARLSLDRLFLKMDTQGCDLEVFDGASECLSDIPAILSELSFNRIYEGAPAFTESIDRFAQSGYLPSFFSPISLDASGAAIEMDCVFVSSERAAGSK